MSFFERVGNQKAKLGTFNATLWPGPCMHTEKRFNGSKVAPSSCNRPRKLSIRKGCLPEQLCSYELLKSINYHKDDWIFNRSFWVFEASPKNFQQVFHYGSVSPWTTTSMLSCGSCFRRDISWRGWTGLCSSRSPQPMKGLWIIILLGELSRDVINIFRYMVYIVLRYSSGFVLLPNWLKSWLQEYISVKRRVL